MSDQPEIYVVGDIHGNFKALKQAFERAGIDKGKDLVIQLGDVADGYPDVPKCVDFLLRCKNLIAIRGNHDAWCHDWFESGATPSIWTSQGGRATINAYLESGKNSDPLHRGFWNNQVDYHVDDENRLFVHGGYDPDIGFKASLEKSKIQEPNELHWNRSLWQRAQAIEKKRQAGQSPAMNSQPFEKGFSEIFIGHTAHMGEIKACNVWNLDTAAGFNGKLTIMKLPGHETYQSDPAEGLYKDYRIMR